MSNGDKIILDLCGGTGSWSDPYRRAGYDVRLITLPQYNVFTFSPPKGVYGILAAPMCTEFSWARTNASFLPRDLKKGMKLVSRCLEIIWECSYQTEKITSKKPSLKFWALENPRGFLQYFLGKPGLEFNPFDYGDRYQKATQLWGSFAPPRKIQLHSRRKKKSNSHETSIDFRNGLRAICSIRMVMNTTRVADRIDGRYGDQLLRRDSHKLSLKQTDE